MTELDARPPGSETTGQAEQAPGRRHRRKGRHRSRRGRLLELGVVIAVAVVVAIGIRTFAFEAFYVPSTSMYPTLRVGDRIIVDKLLFNYHDLTTGDIIVFHRPAAANMCAGDEGDLVKRVIGLPGQLISSKGNTVYINGKPLKEPWLPKVDPLGSKAIAPTRIPKNSFYVLGDNRAISCDSRYWGTVPGPSIVGRVVALIWRGGRPDLHFF